MAYLFDSYTDWVQLMVNYFFLNNNDDTRLCFAPRTLNDNWPSKA